ncbi:MAG TPA: S1C family serine protease [Devosia sp.]|nr:S1C family serine protease [Devosia sp.]
MPTELQSLSDAIASVVAAASPRLVAISGADGSVASGLIWRTGLVVSAHEALGGEEEFTVTFAGGETAKAEAAGRDPSTDVALLRVSTAQFADWPQAPTPAVGSLAVIAGRGEYSATAGIATVSEIGPAWRSMRGGLIDARIKLGTILSTRTEGGAVLSPDGGLIGMAVTGPRHRALAIPASTVARAVDTLAAKGYVPRGYLGATLHPVAGNGGALIVGLEPDGPAQRAGLLLGDIITTWGGDAVETVSAVSHRLSAESVGTTIKLGVLRGGSPVSIDVTVGERPRA